MNGKQVIHLEGVDPLWLLQPSNRKRALDILSRNDDKLFQLLSLDLQAKYAHKPLLGRNVSCIAGSQWPGIAAYIDSRLSRLIPELQWTSPEPFSTQERTILIPKFSMHFRKVSANPAFGNKPIVEWDGEPVYPELAVARLLKKHGLDAVWIDSYRRKFWESMSQQRALPNAAREAYARILQANGGKRGGCWDVMAWKQGEFSFIELKQNTPECRDRISEKQRNWLQAALRAGFAEASFSVCEWCYSTVSS